MQILKLSLRVALYDFSFDTTESTSPLEEMIWIHLDIKR
jgi:hypothetical protein